MFQVEPPLPPSPAEPPAASVAGVLLDRDGVINEDRGFVHRREDFVFQSGVVEALQALQRRFAQVVVVTNQSGIGRGLYSGEAFRELTEWMLVELAAHGVHLAGVYHCPHDPGDGCGCRKPEPGMLQQAAADWNLDLALCWMVGDKPSDMTAARRAGVGGRVLLPGPRSTAGSSTDATHHAASLLEAAESICQPRTLP